jgi:Spy/CpxP family protein refolding chaperone
MKLHGARRLAPWAAVGALLIAGVATVFAAHAQGPHGGPEMGGHGDPGMMMFGGPHDRMGRGLDRMLDGLGVSDAQRDQIHQISKAAENDMRAAREGERAMHERGVQIFTAPTVDAAAAESLRQQMVAQHDQASKRMLQAMLDIANVLTPAQRAKIGDRIKEREAIMKDRMERMERMHRDHGQTPAHLPPPQK